jgi:DNA-binding MarR family transcriptional regulator
MVEMLQAATRVLAGVALRGLDVLDGTVSLPQFRMLAVLADLGRARSVQVARALGLDASTVTRLADRLIAAGHVARGSDPDNRTVVTLELTDSGRNLVVRVVGWRRRELVRILGLLAPDDQDTLTAALQQLVEASGWSTSAADRAGRRWSWRLGSGPAAREPDPFSLADPTRVRAVPAAAGFASSAVTPHSDHLVIDEDRIPEVALTSTRVGGVRQALADADEPTRQRALAAIEAALRARLADGQVRATRGVLLVTATA